MEKRDLQTVALSASGLALVGDQLEKRNRSEELVAVVDLGPEGELEPVRRQDWATLSFGCVVLATAGAVIGIGSHEIIGAALLLVGALILLAGLAQPDTYLVLRSSAGRAQFKVAQADVDDIDAFVMTVRQRQRALLDRTLAQLLAAPDGDRTAQG